MKSSQSTRTSAGSSSTRGKPRSKKSARPLDLKTHEFDKGGRATAILQVGFRVAEPLAVFRRQVNAANVEIARDILPEVGKLQPGADAISKKCPLAVVAFAQVKHQVTHGIGGVTAVVEKLVECLVALDALILLESEEQFEERLRRDVKPNDRFVQSNHHGMVYLVLITMK